MPRASDLDIRIATLTLHRAVHRLRHHALSKKSYFLAPLIPEARRLLHLRAPGYAHTPRKIEVQFGGETRTHHPPDEWHATYTPRNPPRVSGGSDGSWRGR